MDDSTKKTILIVDDDLNNLELLSRRLQEHYVVKQASSGLEALTEAAGYPIPDLILLDIKMPDIDGFEVIRKLKRDNQTKAIPVIFVTGLGKSDEEAKGLELGAVDYITKPFSMPVVMARINNHLELKALRDGLQEVADEYNMELDLTLSHLKKTFIELNEVHIQIKQSWVETIYRLTRAAEYKDEETGDHIKRVSLYTKELAGTMGMDREFVEAIYYASPIHDIGKVGIPDDILLKPGNLTPEEAEIMKTHTIVGAEILSGSKSSFMNMARDIALSHHERWNGKGYPNGLAGEEIPISGRIMNIVDQYDALRSRRPFKSSFSHTKTLEIITKGDNRTTPDDFDPAVFDGFMSCADRFNEIYSTFKD